jgi:predicted GNAT family N-acyltransferase
MPKYFALDERQLFEDWLTAQEAGKLAHPVSSKEYFYIIEVNQEIVGCAGYLTVKDQSEIYLAWGMVDQKLHKAGFGKALLKYRLEEIENNYPDYKVSVATTQDIAPFFQKFGFKILNITKNYYSENLDRYDMQKF